MRGVKAIKNITIKVLDSYTSTLEKERLEVIRENIVRQLVRKSLEGAGSSNANNEAAALKANTQIAQH